MGAGINVAQDFEEQNTEAFLDTMNPATSLVCDAASLAAFYEIFTQWGKTPTGQSLVSENILKKYTSRQVFSWDRSLRIPLAVGRGFFTGSLFPSSFSWWNTTCCFGHAGGFSCLAFGEYQTNISAAIITNENRSASDFMKRFVPLAHGLRDTCRG